MIRKRLLTAVALTLLATLPAAAGDALRIVATIPDLAEIAERIGGERVEVDTLARGMENVHAVPLRPSAIVHLNKADALIQVGLSLEHAYVPGLIEAARNRRIFPGTPGLINVSDGWEPIQVPPEISRGFAADLHPQGNPHINLSQGGGRFIADRILEGLIGLEPESEALFRANHAAFAKELTQAEARWRAVGERLRGSKVVAYHQDFGYLARDLGIEVIGWLEPRPGVPPTPNHLARLARDMRDQEVPAILTARWSNNRSVDFLADKTGAKVVELPEMVQTKGEPDTWIEMMDAIHERLEAALAKP